jgi:hypothetical protein
MADTQKVKKGDFIQMRASIESSQQGGPSYSPGQVLEVGKDIDEHHANAYVNEPESDPRATALSKEDGKRLKHEQGAGIEVPLVNEQPRQATRGSLTEVEAESRTQRDQSEDDGDDEEGEDEMAEDEERSEEEQAEQATSPQAETRETATQKRSRRRVKPPEDPGNED